MSGSLLGEGGANRGCGKAGRHTHRAHVCVCARALASVCSFVAPRRGYGDLGPRLSGWDVWLKKFGAGELETGRGSTAFSLWLQKPW